MESGEGKLLNSSGAQGELCRAEQSEEKQVFTNCKKPQALICQKCHDLKASAHPHARISMFTIWITADGFGCMIVLESGVDPRGDGRFPIQSRGPRLTIWNSS